MGTSKNHWHKDFGIAAQLPQSDGCRDDPNGSYSYGVRHTGQTHHCKIRLFASACARRGARVSFIALNYCRRRSKTARSAPPPSKASVPGSGTDWIESLTFIEVTLMLFAADVLLKRQPKAKASKESVK